MTATLFGPNEDPAITRWKQNRPGRCIYCDTTGPKPYQHAPDCRSYRPLPHIWNVGSAA